MTASPASLRNIAPGPARGQGGGMEVGAAAVSALGGVALSGYVAQHSLIGARWSLIGIVALWVVVWIVGARAVVRLRPRRAVVLGVMVVAAALRLAAATGTTPSISADLYRYSWDAHVQISGTDPYRYPPDAPQLRNLREPPWYPTPAGCRHIHKHPGCTTIDRSGVRTIYPPVAEAWFDLVYLAAPGEAGSRPWQIAGGLVDDAVILLLALSLRKGGRDPRQVAWYAWCPAPVIEFAGNGHVDGLALLALVAATMALRRGRHGVAGVLIGMATMVKLYPAVALLAGWRRGRWKVVAGFLIVVLVAETPHVLVVGARILGYLPGYLHEEHYESGARFLLIGLLPLPGTYVAALAALAVLAAATWVVWNSVPGRPASDPAIGVIVLLAAVIFVASPVQPWYAVTLGGMGTMVQAPWLLLPSLTGEPYYAAVILAARHQVAVGRLAYLVAGAGVLWGLSRRLDRTRHPGPGPGTLRGGYRSPLGP